jgi:L-asparaginase
MRRVSLITTGGTIEKTYDEMTGTLENRRSIVGRMLESLRLEETEICIVELLKKDSLLMTDEDRERIVAEVRSQGGGGDTKTRAGGAGAISGIVILHGTDTLTVTGERLLREFPKPAVPIILTGAMRPFEMVRSDALQNLTEAIFAAGILPPGVYCCAHGRVLAFPGVVKDRSRGTFVSAG